MSNNLDAVRCQTLRLAAVWASTLAVMCLAHANPTAQSVDVTAVTTEPSHPHRWREPDPEWEAKNPLPLDGTFAQIRAWLYKDSARHEERARKAEFEKSESARRAAGDQSPPALTCWVNSTHIYAQQLPVATWKALRDRCVKELTTPGVPKADAFVGVEVLRTIATDRSQDWLNVTELREAIWTATEIAHAPERTQAFVVLSMFPRDESEDLEVLGRVLTLFERGDPDDRAALFQIISVLAIERERGDDRLGPHTQRVISAMRPLWDAKGGTTAIASQKTSFAGGAASESLIPEFIERLRGNDPVKSRYAAHALSRLGPRAAPALPAVIDHLRDVGRGPGRLRALSVVGAIGPAAAPAVPALIELIDSGDLDEAEAGASSLYRLGSAAKLAIPALRAAAARFGERGLGFALQADDLERR